MNFPIEGMESVVATVSGYRGVDRFNLIKLISRSGASYVGKMSNSITHLVCWEFEGKKYEIAKKFNTVVVNHRWIEECVKKGRRVPEYPYTFQCGQDVGPLLLDIPPSINEGPVRPKSKENSKRPVIDIESDEPDDTLLNGSFLDEASFPEFRRDTHGSHRSKRKTIARNSNQNYSYESRNNLHETVLSGSLVPEQKDPSIFRRLKRRNSSSLEPHGRDMAEAWHPVQVSSSTRNHGVPPYSSDADRCQNASVSHALNVKCSQSGRNDNDFLIDQEKMTYDVNDDDDLCIEGPKSPILTNSEDHSKAGSGDTIGNHGNRLPPSAELSCVICWTDFSFTRGVLPCGHRFCFQCIRDWGKHMGKASTCPLCKASFISITKMDGALSSDQKIYSQTIPQEHPEMDVYILPNDKSQRLPANPTATVCYRCLNREPEDLLIRCHLCQIRCVHSYCLDPLPSPWTCVHCSDLRRLYYHS